MNRVFIIAEAGVNHNGSIENALALIDVAAEAGADAVKFQTFKSEAVISRFAAKAAYQVQSTGSGESQLDMVRKLELNESAHEALVERCAMRGMLFLSTPFDSGSADFLVRRLNMPTIKIPSGEITNGPLLLQLARYKRPVILSTGMSTMAEIEQALGVLAFGYSLPEGAAPSLNAFTRSYCLPAGQLALKQYVTLLHCTTEYPAPLAEVNLNAMATLHSAFGLPVGYSDHTQGITVPIAAAALGAVVIEKHFTLDNNLPGPDHKASLEPMELTSMVRAIRAVELALGSAQKIPTPSELKNMPIARKSMVAATAILAGERLCDANLTAKRPGAGISPMSYWELLGTPAMRDYSPDEAL
jgi:N-acetylneuraminate synthase